MANITASIRHGLSNLTNFTGRDHPGQYWPYAITLFVVQMIAGLAFTLPLIINSMKAGFNAAQSAAAQGTQINQAQLQAQMMHDTMAADPNAVINHMGAIQAAAWLPWVGLSSCSSSWCNRASRPTTALVRRLFEC